MDTVYRVREEAKGFQEGLPDFNKHPQDASREAGTMDLRSRIRHGRACGHDRSQELYAARPEIL